MECTLVIIVRAIVEVAGYALIGQGVLFVFAGASRHKNFVYQLFVAVTNPAIRLTRFVTPRFIADQHIGLVTFFLLFWVWILLTYAKLRVCVA